MTPMSCLSFVNAEVLVFVAVVADLSKTGAEDIAEMVGYREPENEFFQIILFPDLSACNLNFDFPS